MLNDQKLKLKYKHYWDKDYNLICLIYDNLAKVKKFYNEEEEKSYRDKKVLIAHYIFY